MWTVLDIKILLVDDEPLNIELLEALLAPEGYSLEKARNGQEALRLAKSFMPDMILLDVMMPGMSGFQVLEEIRNNADLRTIPVILLTALADREHRIRGLKAGADDYISKPFDKTELVNRVRTQAGLSIFRRQINEKDKLIRIIELITEGIIVTDAMFNIQHSNALAGKLLGLTTVEGNLADIFLEKFKHVFDIYSDSGVFITEIAETADAAASYLSTQFKKAADTPGNPGNLVFVLRDVSEEQGRNKMKKDFLSLISGRLRAPMAVLTGYSRIIATHPPQNQLKELTSALILNSAVIENLVSRILFFTEIDNTSADSSPNEIDIRQMAERLELIYRKPFELKTDNLSGKVLKWQKIVIEELVENAFKFSNKGKLSLKVTISDDWIVVEDNGPGIALPEQERVFEPFYQLKHIGNNTAAGAGLGLSIIKRLAESNNRVISIETPQSGGLRMIIGSRGAKWK